MEQTRAAVDQDALKECTHCHKKFPPTDEYFYRRANGGLYAHCKICQRAVSAGKPRKRKKKQPVTTLFLIDDSAQTVHVFAVTEIMAATFAELKAGTVKAPMPLTVDYTARRVVRRK